MKILTSLYMLVMLPCIFSQPQIKVSVAGGYNIPLPDLKGDIASYDDNFNTYTMKPGFGFGANVRYFFSGRRNTGVTLYIGYQIFSTSADTLVIFNPIATFTAKDLKRTLNIFTVGAGLEYSFMPAGKINPFVGAEFMANFFSGGYEYTFQDFDYQTDQRSETRYGLAGGFGLDVSLSKSIAVLAGAKYHIANLIGKDSTGASAKYYGLDDSQYISVLGDKINARTISFIQAYIGVTYFFNQPKRVSKREN